MCIFVTNFILLISTSMVIITYGRNTAPPQILQRFCLFELDAITITERLPFNFYPKTFKTNSKPFSLILTFFQKLLRKINSTGFTLLKTMLSFAQGFKTNQLCCLGLQKIQPFITYKH